MGSRTPRILPIVARGRREEGEVGRASVEERKRGRKGRRVSRLGNILCCGCDRCAGGEILFGEGVGGGED